MAPHVQRVFGASFGAVGKLLFSAPSVSLARSPVPGSSPLSYPPGPTSLSLSFRRVSSRDPHPHAVSRLLFYFLTPPSPTFQAHPARTRGPSISSPRSIFDIPRRKKNKERKAEGRKRGKKAPGAPASQRNVKLGYVKTRRWRFSLKPMGD